MSRLVRPGKLRISHHAIAPLTYSHVLDQQQAKGPMSGRISQSPFAPSLAVDLQFYHLPTRSQSLDALAQRAHALGSAGGTLLSMPRDLFSYSPDQSRADSRAETLAQQAIALGSIPANVIRNMTPVSAPQALFPSKGGKVTQFTVQDVLGVGRQPLYRSWRSGVPQQATTLTDDGYSGSTRNSLDTQ